MAVSGITRNRSFIGGGTIYLKEMGASAGAMEIGNADDFTFAINEDKQTQRNFKQKGGGNIASQSSISDVTATVNVLSMSPQALSVAMRSLITTNPSEVVAAEQQQAYLNSFIRFSATPDADETITVTGVGGTPTYVAGDDYQVKSSGIFIPNDSSIGNDVAVELNYTSVETYTIEGITRSAIDYEIIFDGFNDADNGKAVTVECHKVTFSPASALSLISEDFGSLPMTFEVLADETKDGSSESQYFSVTMEA